MTTTMNNDTTPKTYTDFLDVHGSDDEDDGGVIQAGHAVVSTTASRFGESFLSMFRWKQSCFKLIWKQVVIYYIVYATVTLIYNYVLDISAQATFDSIANYFARFISALPVVMLLGFFTSTALSRWFTTIQNVPGTSKEITLFIETLKEDAPDGRLRIDTHIRYVLLFWLLNFRVVCEPLRRKYPNLLAIQTKLGLLLDHERCILEKHKELPGGKKTVPLVVFDWIRLLLRDTLRNERFANNQGDFMRNLDAMHALRKSGGNIIKFATQNIPNVLIQTVTIAIYFYGLVTILGHQLAEKDPMISFLNGYLPVPYALSFFFYYVWLKVGRIATDPFGADDEDINIVLVFKEHVSNANRLRKTYAQSTDYLLPATNK